MYLRTRPDRVWNPVRGRERSIFGIRGRWLKKDEAKVCSKYIAAISQLKQTAMDGY